MVQSRKDLGIEVCPTIPTCTKEQQGTVRRRMTSGTAAQGRSAYRRLTSVVALLLIAFTSALPNSFSSASMKMSDTTQPQNTMMGQSLKDLGIEVCPDKLHLCPGTAKCCQKEDGKWGCCPKTVATIGSYPAIYLILHALE
ncbi:hypothetical protein AVEN_234555-1 [Araneus ventricosus]|uniref:Granulins domain-containing protein n=1 Tax=Araneus ventricosus TaxID=182803 RepID=A0A4Y2A9D4_ARAVE|nr:hypothetical protein AVEN_234555-1 [Araneus ventricosus]